MPARHSRGTPTTGDTVDLGAVAGSAPAASVATAAFKAPSSRRVSGISVDGSHSHAHRYGLHAIGGAHNNHHYEHVAADTTDAGELVIDSINASFGLNGGDQHDVEENEDEHDDEYDDEGDSDLVSDDENTTKNHYGQKYIHELSRNLLFAGLWFIFSTGLSIYNKQLLGKEQYAFNFPLLIVSLHALGHYLMASALMYFMPHLRPKTRPSITHFLTRIVPAAACTALDISMSNASLHYISLSFYTMVKSSTPVWVLIFAFMFGLEKPKLELVLVILMICSGVVFTVVGEIRFSFIGFMLILGASIMSGLRWSLTQILLQQANIGINNPVATLHALSPVGAAFIGALAVVLELDSIVASPFFGTIAGVMQSFGIIALGSVLAFCMILAEFFLIRGTSVVTLSVIGMSKEIFVISVSMLVFGDILTPMMVVGVLITFSGIAVFHRLRTRHHGHGSRPRRQHGTKRVRNAVAMSEQEPWEDHQHHHHDGSVVGLLCDPSSELSAGDERTRHMQAAI